MDDVLADARWDVNYLGMQLLIEASSLSALGLLRSMTTSPLVKTITSHVIQDKARHVSFGRSALKHYYSQLSSSERLEREELCACACSVLTIRFVETQVWSNLGLDIEKCTPGLKNQGLRAPWVIFFSHELLLF